MQLAGVGVRLSRWLAKPRRFGDAPGTIGPERERVKIKGDRSTSKRTARED